MAGAPAVLLLRRSRSPATRSRPGCCDHDWIDEPVQRAFLGLVEPGTRVLDLGCHLGTFSLPAAALGASVLASRRGRLACRAARGGGGAQRLRPAPRASSGRSAAGSGPVALRRALDPRPSVGSPTRRLARRWSRSRAGHGRRAARRARLGRRRPGQARHRGARDCRRSTACAASSRRATPAVWCSSATAPCCRATAPRSCELRGRLDGARLRAAADRPPAPGNAGRERRRRGPARVRLRLPGARAAGRSGSRGTGGSSRRSRAERRCSRLLDARPGEGAGYRAYAADAARCRPRAGCVSSPTAGRRCTRWRRTSSGRCAQPPTGRRQRRTGAEHAPATRAAGRRAARRTSRVWARGLHLRGASRELERPPGDDAARPSRCSRTSACTSARGELVGVLCDTARELRRALLRVLAGERAAVARRARAPRPRGPARARLGEGLERGADGRREHRRCSPRSSAARSPTAERRSAAGRCARRPCATGSTRRSRSSTRPAVAGLALGRGARARGAASAADRPPAAAGGRPRAQPLARSSRGSCAAPAARSCRSSPSPAELLGAADRLLWLAVDRDRRQRPPRDPCSRPRWRARLGLAATAAGRGA